MSPQSRDHFVELGDAVLNAALSLLETGSVPPQLDGAALQILWAIHSSKGRRASVEGLSDALAQSQDQTRTALAELEGTKLIDSRRRLNTPEDYGVTALGVARMAVARRPEV